MNFTFEQVTGAMGLEVYVTGSLKTKYNSKNEKYNNM
jgi:hypothetical protein